MPRRPLANGTSARCSPTSTAIRHAPSVGPATQALFNNIRWPTAGNPNVESIQLGPMQQGFDSYYGVLTNNQVGNGNYRAFV